MKHIKIKSAVSLVICLIMIMSMQVMSVSAKKMTKVSAKCENGQLIVSGDTDQDVMAVAIFVYDKSDKLVRMESEAVNDAKFEHTFSDKAVADKASYVKVADYAGGDYMQAQVENASAVLIGDANGDEAINAKDVLVIRKHIATLPVEINLVTADCNADTLVNAKDVLLLRKYIANWDVKLGVQPAK